MRHLEIRRHTMRSRPGKHLSQAGVNLARRLGVDLGPYAFVFSSPKPRAIETAIAMGLAVDERIAGLAWSDAGVGEEVDWTHGFLAHSRAVALGGASARAARRQAALWRSLATRLADGATALAISHGGIIEAGAVGCLPDADHAAWGRALDYCEGVRLAFDCDRFVAIEILRLDVPVPIDERIVVTPPQ